MNALHVGLLLAYASGMSVGQLLFKLAADSAISSTAAVGAVDQLGRVLLNPFFILAMAMYFGLSLMWVWILSFIPLSRAYPFVAAAFIVTPLLAHVLFKESLDLRFGLGLVLIVSGLLLVAGSRA